MYGDHDFALKKIMIFTKLVFIPNRRLYIVPTGLPISDGHLRYGFVIDYLSMKLLAFSGSLRKNSYNRALLRVAQSVAPSTIEFETFDLSTLPMFNEDLNPLPRASSRVQKVWPTRYSLPP
jgi:hypothetical protein